MPIELAQWQIDYYQGRQAKIVETLAKLDACLDAFLSNPITSYTLNTGQTVQQVTKAQLPALREWRDQLQGELYDVLTALNVTDRSAYFRPGF